MGVPWRDRLWCCNNLFFSFSMSASAAFGARVEGQSAGWKGASGPPGHAAGQNMNERNGGIRGLYNTDRDLPRVVRCWKADRRPQLDMRCGPSLPRDDAALRLQALQTRVSAPQTPLKQLSLYWPYISTPPLSNPLPFGCADSLSPASASSSQLCRASSKLKRYGRQHSEVAERQTLR